MRTGGLYWPACRLKLRPGLDEVAGVKSCGKGSQMRYKLNACAIKSIVHQEGYEPSYMSSCGLIWPRCIDGPWQKSPMQRESGGRPWHSAEQAKP